MDAGQLKMPQLQEASMNDVGGSALDFAKTQDANINSSFQEYLKTSQSQEKPLDIYERLEGEAGVPELRKTATTLSGQINDIEDSLRRVETDVYARSKNSLMTDAQRRGAVNEGKRPMTENLGWLGQSLGRVMNGIQLATGDIGNKVGLAVQGNQMDLEPYKMKINLASESAARMMTGFTADRETKLSILLDKINRQERMSMFEIEQANQLAREEKQYSMQRDALSKQTQVIEVGGRTKLVNTQTGQVIQDLGVTKAPSTGSSGTVSSFLSSLSSGANKTSSSSAPKQSTAPKYNTKLDWKVNSSSSATLKDKVGF